MKTTLNIDDAVMRRLKEEAARTGRTMSELVEAGIRLILQERLEATPELLELPTWQSGGALVDVADRDALHDVMEGR
ncbi:MAG: ribbon-helix-helix protein, CopG family [Gemmatimonadota bacterium]|nr:ribbon-helix-helix protein, CopG family [Gemmatimonadota bacterium]